MRASDDPLISVVVLNYNGASLLPDCLTSLEAQDYPKREIIVADNGSTDGSREVAARYEVGFLPLAENLGYGGGNNAAARAAEGRYVFFVNNDMKFQQDCITRLVEGFGRSPSIFATDATQLDWAGTTLIHGVTRISPGGLRGWFPFLEVDFAAPMEGEVFVPWAGGGAFMVRRDLFLELGGFDETFFIDFEDLDLCWRAGLRGWRVLYVPSAVVYHKVGASFPDPKRLRRRALSSEANFQRFILKNLSPALAAKVLGGKALQWAGLCLAGRWSSASVIGGATLRTLSTLPEILRERRRNLSTTAVGSEEFLGYHLRGGGLP